MKTDQTMGHLDLLLLAIISESPAHGYAVITQLRERSNRVLALKEGSVYPALHRLEDVGLLVSEWQPVAGRRRRLYRVTPEGAAALRVERRDWRALVSSIEAVLRPGRAVAGARQ
jgi:DNA-binding PadR family transcriptional regulator